MPCLRASQPMPPPRVRPPRPTEPVSPNGVANPCWFAAHVYSPAVAPPWAEPMPRTGSMSMARSAPRSISIPPSLVEWPATLWPPPRDGDLEVEVAGRDDRPRDVDRATRGGRSARAAGRSGCCARRAPRRSRDRRRRGRDRRSPHGSRAGRIPGRRGRRSGGRGGRIGAARSGRRGRRRGPASRSSPWTVGWVRSIGAIGDLILAGRLAGATGRAMPARPDAGGAARWTNDDGGTSRPSLAKRRLQAPRRSIRVRAAG